MNAARSASRCRRRSNRRRDALGRPKLLALLAGLLAACAPAGGDDAGAAVAAPPRRVVSLAPSCTETLVELGLAETLVGISDYCPELPAGARAVRVGGLLNLNVESVLALEPDLVLTVQAADDRSLATLRRRGVQVRAEDPQSLEAMLASVEQLGALFCVEPRASALVESLRARLARVAAAAAARNGASGPPRVYVEVDYPQCWTVGRRSFVHDALRAAGAENLFADLDKAYAAVSKEEIATRAPDWILLLHAAERPLAERVELARLPAVQEGRVITELDRDDLLHSSPRLVRGIEALAERLARR